MPAPPLKQWHILHRVTTRRHWTRGGVCYLRLRLHCCCTAVVQAAPKNPGLFYIHTWYKHLITRTIVKRKARIWRAISLTIFGVKREWKYATKVYVLRDQPGCQQAWKLFTDMHIVRENLKKSLVSWLSFLNKHGAFNRKKQVFAGHLAYKRTWWFELTQLVIVCVQHFFNRSRHAVVAGACRRYLAWLSVFSSVSLKNKPLYSCHIFGKIVLHVMFLKCFCFKRYKEYKTSKQTGTFWRTLHNLLQNNNAGNCSSLRHYRYIVLAEEEAMVDFTPGPCCPWWASLSIRHCVKSMLSLAESV